MTSSFETEPTQDVKEKTLYKPNFTRGLENIQPHSSFDIVDHCNSGKETNLGSQAWNLSWLFVLPTSILTEVGYLKAAFLVPYFSDFYSTSSHLTSRWNTHFITNTKQQ